MLQKGLFNENRSDNSTDHKDAEFGKTSICMYSLPMRNPGFIVYGTTKNLVSAFLIFSRETIFLTSVHNLLLISP
jgi:hypothetical protein